MFIKILEEVNAVTPNDLASLRDEFLDVHGLQSEREREREIEFESISACEINKLVASDLQ